MTDVNARLRRNETRAPEPPKTPHLRDHPRHLAVAVEAARAAKPKRAAKEPKG